MTSSRMIPVDRVLEILDSQRNHLRRERDAMIDSVRDAILGEFPDATPAPTEQPHVTPVGDGIGVKPLGSPDPAPALSQQDAAVVSATLSDHQADALRYVAAEAIRYRGQVVVSRHLNKSSARALERRGLLVSRMNPSTSWGFALTERGKAVADALNAPPYQRH